MSVVTQPTRGDSWAKVKFYYKHQLDEGTLTATSTASGYNVANIYNRLEISKWKSAITTTQYINLDIGAGSTVTADYLIIHGHNFGTAGITYTLQYSDDNFSADTNDSFTGVAATADTTILKEFTEQTDRYWRLKIENATAVPEIGICYWGQKTELDYCTRSFDPNAEENKDTVNVSDTGYVTGVYTKYIQRQMKLTFTDAEFNVYEDLVDWKDDVGRGNFVVAWEIDTHPTDVYLMRNEGKFNQPLVRQGQYRDITLNLVGRK